jgi:hypothetical protein
VSIMSLTLPMTVAACLLAGCAFKGKTTPYGSPAELAAEDRDRLQDLRQCLIEKAPRFDDGISDALTIGRAVAQACHQEGERSLLAKSRATGIKEQNLRPAWPKTLADMATQTVLARRAHAAKPSPQSPTRPARQPDPA